MFRFWPVVLIVVAVTKAHEGAWIILLLLPVLVLLFRLIHQHYRAVAAQLSLAGATVPGAPRRNTVLVPISGLHRPVVRALDYARTISPDVRALYVDLDAPATERLRRDWDRWGLGVPLTVIPSPFRSLLEPLLAFIAAAEAEDPDGFVTVVLPEFVPARWWHHALHNQRALLIKAALLFHPHAIVTSVPFRLAR